MQGFKINYFIYIFAFFAFPVLCCNYDNKSQTNSQIADKEKAGKIILFILSALIKTGLNWWC